MEEEIAGMITATLNASSAFTTLMGSVFPLVADEGTGETYAVYRIDESTPASKDGAEYFSVSIVLVFPSKQYLAALRMKNTVKNIFKTTGFDYRFSDTGFDEDTQCIISLVNFEIGWQ